MKDNSGDKKESHGPAEAYLRRQAARRRPHPRRLHPEGEHTPLGPSSSRWNANLRQDLHRQDHHLLSLSISPSDQAVNLVPFVEQKLGQVRTVLTSDSGNQCRFVVWVWRSLAVDCRSGSGIVVLGCHCCLSLFDLSGVRKNEKEREGKRDEVACPGSSCFPASLCWSGGFLPYPCCYLSHKLNSGLVKVLILQIDKPQVVIMRN